MRYTTGPVITTYNHTGYTILAILLCLATEKLIPLLNVNRMNGNDNPAKMICVINMKK